MRVRKVTRTGRMRALVGFAAFGAFWGTWGASLPRVQLEAGVTDAQLGTALLWVGVGALLSIRYVGGLTDRADQWVLPVSIATLAVAGAAPAFVHGVVALSMALLVLGMCAGGVDAAINAAAVRAETHGHPVLNLVHGVFSLAVVASSLGVAGLTRGGQGRAWALVVVGVVLIAAATLTATRSVAAQHPVPGVGPAVSPISWSRPLLLLGALAPAMFALAAATGRLSAHRLTRGIRPATLLGFASALAAAGSAIAALGHTSTWVLAGIALAGLGTSVCAPTLIALAGQPHHGRKGAATGTVITLAYLGFVLGPAAVGLVAGATTLPTALLGVAALALALAAASPLLTRHAAP